MSKRTPSAEEAKAETPVPSEMWRAFSDSERENLVKKCLNQLNLQYEVMKCTPDGEVYVTPKFLLSVDKRSESLLDLEVALKSSIDRGLVVWLEPIGDKNSLRKLRGVEIQVSRKFSNGE